MRLKRLKIILSVLFKSDNLKGSPCKASHSDKKSLPQFYPVRKGQSYPHSSYLINLWIKSGDCLGCAKPAGFEICKLLEGQLQYLAVAYYTMQWKVM